VIGTETVIGSRTAVEPGSPGCVERELLAAGPDGASDLGAMPHLSRYRDGGGLSGLLPIPQGLPPRRQQIGQVAQEHAASEPRQYVGTVFDWIDAREPAGWCRCGFMPSVHANPLADIRFSAMPRAPGAHLLPATAPWPGPR
jgi:hypothetical protein